MILKTLNALGRFLNCDVSCICYLYFRGCRKRLRDLSQELCTSLDAHIRTTMEDCELRAADADPGHTDKILVVNPPTTPRSNTQSTSMVTRPGTEKLGQRPQFDLTGLEHLSTRHADRSNRPDTQSRVSEVSQMTSAQRTPHHYQQSQARQAALRAKLKDWLQNTELAVGDVAMHWTNAALTETDPTVVWSIAAEQSTHADSHGAENEASMLNSGNIAVAAAECRRVTRELQLAMVASVLHPNNLSPSLVNRLSHTAAPINIPSVYRDLAFHSNLQQFCSSMLGCAPSQVPQQLQEEVEYLTNEAENGFGLDDNELFPSAPRTPSRSPSRGQSRSGVRTPKDLARAFIQDHTASQDHHNLKSSDNKFTISERISGKYLEILRLFPVESTSSGSNVGDSSNTTSSLAAAMTANASPTGPLPSIPTTTVDSNYTFMMMEKREIDRVDEEQRVVLHLTCRVGVDLLNITIMYQPQFERLKLSAHCIQMYDSVMIFYALLYSVIVDCFIYVL
jgi:hypothetical protein